MVPPVREAKGLVAEQAVLARAVVHPGARGHLRRLRPLGPKRSKQRKRRAWITNSTSLPGLLRLCMSLVSYRTLAAPATWHGQKARSFVHERHTVGAAVLRPRLNSLRAKSATPKGLVQRSALHTAWVGHIGALLQSQALACGAKTRRRSSPHQPPNE